jgi:arginine exporter protein ArgO
VWAGGIVAARGAAARAGLKTAGELWVGALIARALVHLSGSFITDVPLAIIAVAGFALTLFAGVTFVAVLLGGGIAYELWRNGRSWTHRGNSFSVSPLAVLPSLSGRLPSR